MSSGADTFPPPLNRSLTVQELDVRVIPPREKHPTIHRAFDALRPGEQFVLVNDHNPKPLFYEFQAERAGQFTWTALEEGPQVWRIAIGKRAA